MAYAILVRLSLFAVVTSEARTKNASAGNLVHCKRLLAATLL